MTFQLFFSQRYSGAPVLSYVNTTAAVKTASDICCTPSNAVQIVAAMLGDTVIPMPDKWLAQNVAKRVPQKRMVCWDESALSKNASPYRSCADY